MIAVHDAASSRSSHRSAGKDSRKKWLRATRIENGAGAIAGCRSGGPSANPVAEFVEVLQDRCIRENGAGEPLLRVVPGLKQEGGGNQGEELETHG